MPVLLLLSEGFVAQEDGLPHPGGWTVAMRGHCLEASRSRRFPVNHGKQGAIYNKSHPPGPSSVTGFPGGPGFTPHPPLLQPPLGHSFHICRKDPASLPDPSPHDGAHA